MVAIAGVGRLAERQAFSSEGALPTIPVLKVTHGR